VTPRETNADSDVSVRSSIDVPPDLVVGLLGSADENLRTLERILTADIHVRGNALTLSGEPADVALAERVVAELIAIVAGSGTVPSTRVMPKSRAWMLRNPSGVTLDSCEPKSGGWIASRLAGACSPSNGPGPLEFA